MKLKKFICELCYHTDSVIILQRIRNAKFGNYMNFDVEMCKNCTLIQLHKFSNKQEKQYYYKYNYLKDTYNYEVSPHEYINDQKKRGRNVFNFLKNNHKILKKPLSQLDILDVGCGPGGTLDYFINKTRSINGVDPILESVKLAKKIGYSVKHGFLENLKKPSNSVDLIILLGTIEHAYDLNKALKECKRVLRDKGKILIRWRSNKLWGSPIEYFNSNHYRYFNHESINYMANKFNLNLILKTDLEIENKPGAEYFILEKNKKYKSNKKIKKNIYKKLVNSFKNYENLYFDKASTFLKKIKHFDFDISEAKKYIKNKRNDYRALSYSDEHILRAIIEAKEFIHYYIKY